MKNFQLAQQGQSSSSSGPGNQGPAPMEIDMVHYGKGKNKGKARKVVGRFPLVASMATTKARRAKASRQAKESTKVERKVATVKEKVSTKARIVTTAGYATSMAIGAMNVLFTVVELNKSVQLQRKSLQQMWGQLAAFQVQQARLGEKRTVMLQPRLRRQTRRQM